MTNNVPTRVDFRSQLETNLGRKRKRQRKEHVPVPGKGKTGSKLKKEEKEYKPKMGMKLDDEDAKGSSTTDKVRRTRQKPPSTKEESCWRKLWGRFKGVFHSYPFLFLFSFTFFFVSLWFHSFSFFYLLSFFIHFLPTILFLCFCFVLPFFCYFSFLFPSLLFFPVLSIYSSGRLLTSMKLWTVEFHQRWSKLCQFFLNESKLNKSEKYQTCILVPMLSFFPHPLLILGIYFGYMVSPPVTV